MFCKALTECGLDFSLLFVSSSPCSLCYNAWKCYSLTGHTLKTDWGHFPGVCANWVEAQFCSVTSAQCSGNAVLNVLLMGFCICVFVLLLEPTLTLHLFTFCLTTCSVVRAYLKRNFDYDGVDLGFVLPAHIWNKLIQGCAQLGDQLLTVQ